MTIPQALSKYPIQLSEQLIRVWIQSGNCPFGFVIRQKNGRTGRNTYYICEKALRDFIEGKQNGQTDLL